MRHIIDLFNEEDLYYNNQQFDEREFVDCIGIENYKKLSKKFCGAMIYISDIRKRHNFIKRIIQNKLVASDNHYLELRQEFNLSASYIYNLLHEIKQEKEYLKTKEKK